MAEQPERLATEVDRRIDEALRRSTVERDERVGAHLDATATDPVHAGDGVRGPVDVATIGSVRSTT